MHRGLSSVFFSDRLVHFATLVRIYSHYCKGISGVDSAADALEMELEEFHDFIKDAKLETKLVRFDTMCVVFAKVRRQRMHVPARVVCGRARACSLLPAV